MLYYCSDCVFANRAPTPPAPFLRMFSASALWPLCLLQHFSIAFTPHNPHISPFVSPRLSLCLSQLPVSLILNPVEIGQAEWASFDQALISGVLTVSAHPDPTEPWSPGVRGVGFKQALTPWLRLRGRVKGGCGVPVLRRDLTPFIWDGTFWPVACCGKRIRSQRKAGGCESHTFAF